MITSDAAGRLLAVALPEVYGADWQAFARFAGDAAGLRLRPLHGPVAACVAP
jgi:hypothetical protein